jgi:hypothetical protein
MAKVALVIWLAYSLAKKAERVKTFTVGFLPHLLVAGVFMLLCMKQPDFGSAVVLLLLTFTMLFVAGAKVGYILGASILGAAFGAAAIRFREYRYERYLAWLHMDQHRQDLAYQPFQSVMSFGSGGTTGASASGRGLQTLYLPEAHTDFVAAIVGEELGFVGVAALCARICCSSHAACGRRCARRTTSARSWRSALDDVRGAGAREPRGRAGDPSDQGADVTVRELRRFVAPRERRGGGDAAQHLASVGRRRTRRQRPPRWSSRSAVWITRHRLPKVASELRSPTAEARCEPAPRSSSRAAGREGTCSLRSPWPKRWRRSRTSTSCSAAPPAASRPAWCLPAGGGWSCSTSSR